MSLDDEYLGGEFAVWHSLETEIAFINDLSTDEQKALHAWLKDPKSYRSSDIMRLHQREGGISLELMRPSGKKSIYIPDTTYNIILKSLGDKLSP